MSGFVHRDTLRTCEDCACRRTCHLTLQPLAHSSSKSSCEWQNEERGGDGKGQHFTESWQPQRSVQLPVQKRQLWVEKKRSLTALGDGVSNIRPAALMNVQKFRPWTERSYCELLFAGASARHCRLSFLSPQGEVEGQQCSALVSG